MLKRPDNDISFSFRFLPGLIGAGIGFLVYCWLMVIMWKLGRNNPQYDRFFAVFSFFGYPSEWLISMLCRMRLMYREDLVAVLAVTGVWYTFFGFLIGTAFYLIGVILPKLFADVSDSDGEEKIQFLPRRWFASIVMIIFSIGGFIISLLILFHRINPKNIYIEYSKGIYLFDCILIAILGIVGLLCGISILRHRAKHEAKHKYGISGALVCMIFACTSIGLAIYVMFPVSKTHMCQAHLKDLWLCLSKEYSEINGGEYPNPQLWCDAFREIRPKDSEMLLMCPGSPGNRCNYSINPKAFSNLSPNVVFLYDSKPGWNQSGGPEKLDPNNHAGKGCNVVFGDGRVVFVRTAEFQNLQWD